MAEPLDEPLGVVARDELADDPAGFGQTLDAPPSSMRRVKKACVSSSAIPSWWSMQPSRVTLMLKVKSPMRRV
jgi:hypothetical protein